MITEINDIEHLYELTHFPVFIGCTEQDQNKDLFMKFTCCLIVAVGFLIGQTTGKITGTIKDAETNEALIGHNQLYSTWEQQLFVLDFHDLIRREYRQP